MRNSNRSSARSGFLVGMLALFAGCASLPTDFEKIPSYALRDTAHTTLASSINVDGSGTTEPSETSTVTLSRAKLSSSNLWFPLHREKLARRCRSR